MKPSAYLKKKNELQTKLKAFKEEINEEFTKLVKEFIKSNTHVEIGKVYEFPEKPRKHYKRFVVYDMDTFHISDHVMIRAAGWWLDQFSVPKKWDTLTPFGVGNPDIMVLSENQKHLPHPDKKEATPKIEA